MLRNKLDIPLVEIKVTGYDVLRALRPHIGKDQNIAIVGYQNVVYGCRSIGEMLGLSIHELIIPSEDLDKDWEAAQKQVCKLVADNDIQSSDRGFAGQKSS